MSKARARVAQGCWMILVGASVFLLGGKVGDEVRKLNTDPPQVYELGDCTAMPWDPGNVRLWDRRLTEGWFAKAGDGVEAIYSPECSWGQVR